MTLEGGAASVLCVLHVKLVSYWCASDDLRTFDENNLWKYFKF